MFVEQTSEDWKQEGCTAASNKGAAWAQLRVSCSEAVTMFVAELGPGSPPPDSRPGPFPAASAKESKNETSLKPSVSSPHPYVFCACL